MRSQPPIFSSLFAALSLISTAEALAQTRESVSSIELAPVEVRGEAVGEDPATLVRSADDLSREVVFDARDMVRYQTGVSVSEGGRAGANGYAIRGVDGARVAITVDGMAQAEPFNPGVYAGYGYLNGNRNSVELENMKQVTVHKGPDSVRAGSGGIGGSVQFVTKDIDDFVASAARTGALIKTGYASRNREWLGTAGAGLRFGEGSSLLLQHTRRRGTEMRHYGGGEDLRDWKRGIPDPVRRNAQAWLAKMDLCLVREHCLLLSYEQRRETVATDEHSYNGFGETRRAWDSSPYDRQALVYRWRPMAGALESFSLGLHKQKIDQRALTENRDIKDGFLAQRYDRLMQQRETQWRLTGVTRHWQSILGDHISRVEIDFGERRFVNHNLDKRYFKTSTGDQKEYAIIDPVRTRTWSIRATDHLSMGSRWSGDWGLRFDRYEHRRRAGVASASLAEIAGQDKKNFAALTSFARLAYRMPIGLGVAYGVSQGFRAPGPEALYFRFQRGPNFLYPNPALKPEHALNQELTLSATGSAGQMALSLFRTRYRDFIEERHSQRQVRNPYFGQPYAGGEFMTEELFRYENVDSAWLRGVEFNATVDAHAAFGAPRGWRADARFTYVQGRTSLGDGMRALQPWAAVFGVAYTASSEQWGLRLDLTHYAAKKARDTLRTSFGYRGASQSPARHLSGAVTLLDLTGFVQLTSRVSINAGIYNLINRRYFTWDTLRSIPESGTTGRVYGNGINRYSAPGRNYALNLVARF